jgi:HD superfamily phosphohydrolase
MAKNSHEIRDPIHVFVRLDSDERKVLDCAAFQRLRHIHQLALSYLVYPGATHRRFEHSLGVMELAGRVFDVVTHPDNVSDDIRQLLPEIGRPNSLVYWRSVLRMAALCHDVGHLPFSHAAEHLLPEGWHHERISQELICNGELREIFALMIPPLNPEHVAKVAIGAKKIEGFELTTWESILAEIIVGDAFGVDRMDYLLRDSHHAGVAYGRFDHYRLIDTLRILTSPPTPPVSPPGTNQAGDENDASVAATTEHPRQLRLAERFFMYSQLYFHQARRVYNIHLEDFLKAWLPEAKFSIELEDHLRLTDNEVTAAISSAARDPQAPGHDPARRIATRDHFRVLYERHPDDIRINPEAGLAIFGAAQQRFGRDLVRHDRVRQESGAPDFPVKSKDGRIASSLAVSETLNRLEALSLDYVFVDRSILAEATEWLNDNRIALITPAEGANDD